MATGAVAAAIGVAQGAGSAVGTSCEQGSDAAAAPVRCPNIQPTRRPYLVRALGCGVHHGGRGTAPAVLSPGGTPSARHVRNDQRSFRRRRERSPGRIRIDRALSPGTRAAGVRGTAVYVAPRTRPYRGARAAAARRARTPTARADVAGGAGGAAR